MKKVKLVATWRREYWDNPLHYPGCDYAQDMAEMDQQNGSPMDIFDHDDSVFTVEVAKEQAE